MVPTSLGDLSPTSPSSAAHRGSVVLAYRDPTGHAHVSSPVTHVSPAGRSLDAQRPFQSFDDLYRDVTAKIFDRYDDDTWIYPGHGGDTTLGAERPHPSEWQNAVGDRRSSPRRGDSQFTDGCQPDRSTRRPIP